MTHLIPPVLLPLTHGRLPLLKGDVVEDRTHIITSHTLRCFGSQLIDDVGQELLEAVLGARLLGQVAVGDVGIDQGDVEDVDDELDMPTEARVTVVGGDDLVHPVSTHLAVVVGCNGYRDGQGLGFVHTCFLVDRATLNRTNGR